MALTADQQADLNELQAYRKQLRAVVFGGAKSVGVGEMRVIMDIDNARRSLRDCEAQISAYLGTPVARPVVLNVRMSGGYPEDNSNATEVTP